MAYLQGLTFTTLLLLVQSQVDSSSCQKGSTDEACASAMLQVSHFTKPKTATVVSEEAKEVLEAFRMLGQDDHGAAPKKASKESDNSGFKKKKEAAKNQKKQQGADKLKPQGKKGSFAQQDDAKKAPLHKGGEEVHVKSGHLEDFGPLGQRHLIEEGLTVSSSVSSQRSGLHAIMEVTRAHLQEARHCLPHDVLSSHVASLHHEASQLDYLLASKDAAPSRSLQLIDITGKPSKHSATAESGDPDGSSAPLNAAGFKAVTSRCCPQDMEIFFERLLGSMNLQICSKPHVQGLMHWFTCVPDMDFAYLVDVVNNGNPCKYWAAESGICPSLSPECEGEWCR